MNIRRYFAALLLSWTLIIAFANAKTYEASDSDQVSLSALSLVKQQDWAAIELKGDVETVIAQIKNRDFPSPDFQEVKTILAEEENGLEFIGETLLFQKRTRIKFSLKLETHNNRLIIAISNLNVFENIDEEWQNKAFVYMDSQRHAIKGSIEKSYCTQRSSIIYPLFLKSERRDGVLNVFGNVSLDENSMYVDLFKLALAIHKLGIVR